MGYAYCTGPCETCGKLFVFNPRKVPSMDNKVFCRECVEEANEIRKEKGLEPHFIAPNAYEPVDEEEL